jgi:hypothetical protein
MNMKDSHAVYPQGWVITHANYKMPNPRMLKKNRKKKSRREERDQRQKEKERNF